MINLDFDQSFNLFSLSSKGNNETFRIRKGLLVTLQVKGHNCSELPFPRCLLSPVVLPAPLTAEAQADKGSRCSFLPVDSHADILSVQNHRVDILPPSSEKHCVSESHFLSALPMGLCVPWFTELQLGSVLSSLPGMRYCIAVCLFQVS